MTLDVFLFLLLAVSVFTTLTVEAIKKCFGDSYKASSNIVACVVAIVLSVAVGIFYCILANIAFNIEIAIILLALMFLSWLGSMLGYDKIIQSLTQIGIVKK